MVSSPFILIQMKIRYLSWEWQCQTYSEDISRGSSTQPVRSLKGFLGKARASREPELLRKVPVFFKTHVLWAAIFTLILPVRDWALPLAQGRLVFYPRSSYTVGTFGNSLLCTPSPPGNPPNDELFFLIISFVLLNLLTCWETKHWYTSKWRILHQSLTKR